MNTDAFQQQNDYSSKKTLQLAFLGGGINSAVGHVHQIAAEMDKRFQLVAGCFSRHDAINQTTAEQYGIYPERNYQDLSDLINHEVNFIDAIVVLTPTPQHKNHVIQCLEAGIPVICDKSLAATRHEIDEINRALTTTKGYLAVTYNYSGYPMLRELRRLIREGQLGKIEQIHIEMPQEGFAKVDAEGKPMTPQQWRLHDGEMPTLSLDLGVHLHHTIAFLTGSKPLEVVAVQNSFGSFKQVIDNTICIAHYKEDIICNIWFSKAAIGQRNGLKIRIYGQSGAAEWYQLDAENLLVFDKHGQQRVVDRANLYAEVTNQPRYNRFKVGHPAGFIEAFANHYYDIADNLQDYRQSRQQIKHDYVFGIEAASEGLSLLTAINESANTKSWISI